MNMIIRYNCEFCDKVCDTIDEMRQHEATHFGLTYKQYLKWFDLQQKARNAGAKCSITKNVKTEAAFDKACERLVAFEVKHNLTDMEKPKRF